MNEYLDLFGTFAKVGVMTFGGGYAMLPILQREVVEHKGWATEEELMDYFAIGQCTRQHRHLYRSEAPGLVRRHRGHAGRGVSFFGHYFDPGGIDHEFLPFGLGTERLCRDPGMRVCPDLQRRAEAAEKICGG